MVGCWNRRESDLSAGSFWQDWDRIKDWHTRNLDSLNLSSLAKRASETVSDKDSKDDKISRKEEMCEGRGGADDIHQNEQALQEIPERRVRPERPPRAPQWHLALPHLCNVSLQEARSHTRSRSKVMHK